MVMVASEARREQILRLIRNKDKFGPRSVSNLAPPNVNSNRVQRQVHPHAL